MIRNALFVILVLLVAGCQEVIRPEKPENLIPKEKMVAILVEAYTGNAARSVSNKTLREKSFQIDSLIYAKYQVDSLQLAHSNVYYASQLNEYISLMEAVQKELEIQKAKIDSLYIIEQEAGLQKADSIKKARKKETQKKDTAVGQLLDPVESQ